MHTPALPRLVPVRTLPRLSRLMPALISLLFMAALLVGTRVKAAPPTAGWTYTWGTGSGADRIRHTAADAMGNLMLAGENGDAGGVWLFQSLDTNGNLRWSDNAGGQPGAATAVAVDPSGNVIVGGYVNGPNWTWLLRKFTNTGSLLWSVTSAGASHSGDLLWAVTTDAAGNVYAAGSENATLAWAVHKYDPSGTLLWSRTTIMAGNYQDEAYALAIDGSGNLLAAGYGDPTSIKTEILLQRYSPVGAVLSSTLWTLGSGSTGDDRGDSLGVDATGNVYLAGHWMPGPWPYYAWFLRKYDSSLNVTWTVTLFGAPNAESRAERVKVLADGTIAVSGFLDHSTSTGRDWNVADYSASGVLQWTLTYNGAASKADEAMGLEQDTCGNLYVAGFEGTASGSIWRLQKYGSIMCTGTAGVGASLAQATTGTTPSSPFTWTIVVTNTGSQTLNSLTIADTMPAGVLITGTAQPAGLPLTSTATGLYVWSGAALALGPGASFTISVSGRVGAVCASTPVSDVAAITASAGGPTATAYTNSSGFVATPYVTGLTITALQTPAAPPAGSAITYAIVVSNTGSATLAAPVIIDTISPVVMSQIFDQPAGVPVPAVTGTGSGTRYVWSGGIGLPPMTSWTFTISGTMGAVAAPQLVSATAWVAGAFPCGSVAQASNAVGFMAQTVPTTSSLLATSSSSASLYAAGATGLLVLTVTNAGSGACLGVTPHVTWSGSGTILVLATPSGATSLAASGSISFTWTYSCTGGGPLVFSTWASASDQGNGSGIASAVANTTVIIVAPGVLTATVSASPNPFVTGAAGRIIWTLRNQGGSDITGCSPTLTITGGLALASGPSGPVPAGPVTLTPGSSASFTWTLTVLDTGTFGFSLSASGATFGTGTAFVATAGTIVVTTPAVTPPDDGLQPGGVKIVGGIRGYLNPKRGEQATLLVKPTGPGVITVRIYDRRGALLRTMTAVSGGQGTTVLHWDATDETGAAVPAGIYPIVIDGPGIRFSDKLAVLR